MNISSMGTMSSALSAYDTSSKPTYSTPAGAAGAAAQANVSTALSLLGASPGDGAAGSGLLSGVLAGQSAGGAADVGAAVNLSSLDMML